MNDIRGLQMQHGQAYTPNTPNDTYESLRKRLEERAKALQAKLDCVGEWADELQKIKTMLGWP